MCNLYSITTNQAAIITLFRVVNRYVGNLAPMPGVFPDYPAPAIRNTDTGTDIATMRLGHAVAAAHRRSAGHQHPQHVLTALARPAQAGEPLPCPGQQLRRVRAGAEPGDEEEGRGLVRAP
jgi:putative SOS response-associated peptidase YedK